MQIIYVVKKGGHDKIQNSNAIKRQQTPAKITCLHAGAVIKMVNPLMKSLPETGVGLLCMSHTADYKGLCVLVTI
jgi:hypothetical protein